MAPFIETRDGLIISGKDSAVALKPSRRGFHFEVEPLGRILQERHDDAPKSNQVVPPIPEARGDGIQRVKDKGLPVAGDVSSELTDIGDHCA